MFRIRKAAIAALFAVSMAQTAPAQQFTDAKQILSKVAETYKSLKSFEFEGATVLAGESPGMQSKIDLPFKAAFVAPARLRLQTRYPGAGDLLFVSDSHAAWIYMPSAKTYSKIDLEGLSNPSSASTDQEKREALIGASAATGLTFDLFQLGITVGLRKAVIVKEEAVQLEGKTVNCDVVRAEYEQPSKKTKSSSEIRTYWIDKSRFIVLREDSSSTEASPMTSGETMRMSNSTRLTKAIVNQPVPDQLFVLTLPPGAKEGAHQD